MNRHNDKPRILDLVVTLKVQYLNMFFDRKYIQQILSVEPMAYDYRRVALRMLVPEDKYDQVCKYATHVHNINQDKHDVIKDKLNELVKLFKELE